MQFLHHKSIPVFCFIVLVFLFATLAAAASSPELNKRGPIERSPAERGEYLTTILGCAGCHTEGALQGTPHGPPLAGSEIGIAYTDAEDSEFPGIVYPANLTPHKKLGLGTWTRQEIARAIQYGVNHQGGELTTVMPWLNYTLLSKRDTYAIVDYLQSLAPVAKDIPEANPEGTATRQSYLRIGVYLFRPNSATATAKEAPNGSPR